MPSEGLTVKFSHPYSPQTSQIQSPCEHSIFPFHWLYFSTLCLKYLYPIYYIQHLFSLTNANYLRAEICCCFFCWGEGEGAVLCRINHQPLARTCSGESCPSPPCRLQAPGHTRGSSQEERWAFGVTASLPGNPKEPAWSLSP